MLDLVLDGIQVGGIPFLIQCAVLLPVLLPLLQALRALQRGRAKAYAVYLSAALGVGALLLWMLWPFLFGEGLTHGSTSSFIFIVAPIYGALLLLATYGLGALVGRIFLHNQAWTEIPLWAQRLWALPAALLGLLLLGCVLTTAHLLRLDLPAKATHAETFRQLAAQGDVLAPAQKRMAFDMAGNPHAPAEVLDTLSQHGQVAVRVRVATHAHTEAAVLTRLGQDCAPQVRQAAQQRLGLSLSDAADAETRPCTPLPGHQP